MVFFTCNNCGDSVKKPAVEKHYNQRKCSGNQINLSCMDCLKDFYGQEYAAHTKCITEVEKYSGKGYVPKVKTNSNESKQENWTDIVRSILIKTEYQLSNGARNAFKQLQEFENVPRKKAKFLNFTTKCARLSPNYTNECWSVLEKELEIIKQTKQQQIEAAKLKKQQEVAAKEAAKNEVTTNGVVDDEALNPKKSKKEKKHKKSKEQQEEITQQNGDCAVESNETNAEIIVTKKSKKEKKVKQPEETPTQNGYVATNEENIDANAIAKKSKKQKKSIQQNAGTVENGNSEEVIDVETPAKKSKKDKKSKQMNGIEHENVIPTEKKVINLKRKAAVENNTHSEELPPAKKSKKTKNSTTEIEIENGNVNETLNATAEVDDDTFHWVKIIEKLVKKANAASTTEINGISMENLKERLLKKYKTKFGIETLTNKEQKKFGKKFSKYLAKSAMLKIEGDIVKCC